MKIEAKVRKKKNRITLL